MWLDGLEPVLSSYTYLAHTKCADSQVVSHSCYSWTEDPEEADNFW